jgi:hypothetical protein
MLKWMIFDGKIGKVVLNVGESAWKYEINVRR